MMGFFLFLIFSNGFIKLQGNYFSYKNLINIIRDPRLTQRVPRGDGTQKYDRKILFTRNKKDMV